MLIRDPGAIGITRWGGGHRSVTLMIGWRMVNHIALGQDKKKVEARRDMEKRGQRRTDIVDARYSPPVYCCTISLSLPLCCGVR